MIVRKPPKPPLTPSQKRRQAQRQLAKDLRAGKPILPTKITSRAKSVSSENRNLVNQIQAIKQRAFGDRPKWNAKQSRRAIIADDKTGRARSNAELRKILRTARGTRHDVRGSTGHTAPVTTDLDHSEDYYDDNYDVEDIESQYDDYDLDDLYDDENIPDDIESAFHYH
jgi:hypothetical protein